MASRVISVDLATKSEEVSGVFQDCHVFKTSAGVCSMCQMGKKRWLESIFSFAFTVFEVPMQEGKI